MRVIVCTLLLLPVVLCVAVLGARGDGGEADRSNLELKDRVKALELEVKYLRSRDRVLTQYVMGNEARAKGLDDIATKCRNEGFTNNRIPASSRETLLQGMNALATHMRKDLPAVSKEERVLLEQMEKLLKGAKAAAGN